MTDHKDKIKVLVIATSPAVIGGQSIQARRLIDAFADDGAVELRFVPNDPNTPFRGIKYLRTVFASVRFWLSLLISVPRSDVVHVFSSGMSGYAIATLPPFFIARLFGVPAILNYHSGELRDHIEQWPATALPSMRRFESVVVPSEFLVGIFAEHGVAAHSVFNFVDATRFRFKDRERFRPVFLSNRNLEPHYNVGDCLRAFGLIQARIPEARLVIAGAGSEEAELKSLAETIQLKNVDFIGHIQPDRMPELFEECDVYLNTSVVDNMPLSFIESFAAGVPVVSYATGGIPYIVADRESGMLVETGDFEALAARAVEIIEDPELGRRIASNARSEVEKYSFENVRAEWIRVYRAAMS